MKKRKILYDIEICHETTFLTIIDKGTSFSPIPTHNGSVYGAIAKKSSIKKPKIKNKLYGR